MKIGNSTNKPDKSDAKTMSGQSSRAGYRGGRRVSSGGSETAGGPGAKEKFQREARSGSLAHKGSFRSGKQDARSGAGAVSPSAVQLKTRRRGQGSSMATPSASC